uniref:Peptidase S1 domain-containing protein n=1 Tax=Equus caballus TaxID=9796 RepID=A0A9L0TNF7_HORSE
SQWLRGEGSQCSLNVVSRPRRPVAELDFLVSSHKLERKAQQTAAVRPLSLSRGKTQGDSGGPLICNKLNQGIFSYGQNNGTPPGVFMKVSHFLPWIKSTMKRF